jgi:GT2 family glycosyltransferase/glycosyltransferase involved in cell wall biosynthesis
MVRVVVLNWNAAWYTRRCLRALAATDYPPDRLEVVLVDNGSLDGSLPQLRWEFPGVRLLANGRNLGFAEGNNRALRDLDGIDFVALVNNDAVVEPGWLRPLVDALVADPRAGAAAARLLLEPAMVGLTVEAAGEVELSGVSLDGLDITGRVRCDGWEAQSSPAWPFDVTRRLRGTGRVWVPAGPGARHLSVDLAGSAEVTVRAGDAVVAGRAPGRFLVRVPQERVELLNGLGTGLTALGEGFDRHLGSPDGAVAEGSRTGEGPRPEPSDPAGVCGGGTLLRVEMLREVGLFDPRFFAYYEDTDLSWRARRRGWRIVTVPASRLHHAHGGAGGFRGAGFFFLDRRNWLLTTLRNGDPDDVRAVLREARRLATAAFRSNVGSPLKHGRRPDWRLVLAWTRVGAATAAAAPRVRREADRPVGARPTARVRSLLQPRSRPPGPSARPGGPLVVHLDVTDTLRSGWSAGIQRVVRGLVRELAAADERVELVPVVYAEPFGRYRRTTAAEQERLLAPTPPGGRPTPPARISLPHRAAVGVATRLGFRAEALAVRDALRRRRTPADQRALLLDRLEPGSVLLEADAVWNVGGAERSELLPSAALDGVRVVAFVHDLLPFERPEWFDGELVAAFRGTVEAQLRRADLVLTSSEATSSSARRLLAELGRDDVELATVRLGSDPPTGEVGLVPAELAGRRYLLLVGTVEPRKNIGVAVESWDRLADDHPDLHLVVVGREGWQATDLAARMRQHPRAGGHLHWLEGVSDGRLDALYRNAFLVLVPSHSEGYGLPVVESLARGVPVIASDGGALAEVGRGVAELVPATDVDGWVAAVSRHLVDPGHHRRARDRAAGYRPPSWADAAGDVAAELLDRFGTP